MILTCSECDTSFNFDEKYIKDTGSKVRCSKCQNVFLVYPSVAGSDGAAASADESPAPTTEGVTGLDELDLSKFDNMLDVETDSEEKTAASGATDDLGFELDLDLDDEHDSALDETGSDLDETDELDLSSLDLDDAVEPDISSDDDSDELEFDLDFDSDASTGEAEPSLEADSDDDGEFDFGLDDSTEMQSAAPSDDEGFELDLDLDFEDEADKEGIVSDSELEETQDLDLSDMENLFDTGEVQASEIAAAETSDEFDFELDLSDESADDPGAAVPEASAETKDEEEVDFEIDFSEESETAPSEEESKGSDATEELDLSELEDMLEVEEAPPADAEMSPGAVEESFELDLDGIDDDDMLDSEVLSSMDETVALEASDLEDLSEIDLESVDSPVAALDETTDELELDLEPALESAQEDDVAIEDSFDLSDLDEMLESSQEGPTSDSIVESTDDFDLELDFGEQKDDALEAVAEAPPDIIAPTDATEESDLSDLEDLLEIDEEPVVAELDSDLEDIEDIEDIEALDIPLSMEETPETPEALFDTTEQLDDVELKFEADEVSVAAEDADEVVDIPAPEYAEEEGADTFDMGTLPSQGEQPAETAATDYYEMAAEDELAEDMEMPPPTVKRRLGGPIRILLAIVLIIGGGYGTLKLLDLLGIGIDVQQLGGSIPVVGKYFKPQYPDKGNLQIGIIEKLVKYDVVDNSKSGPLFIIEGKLKNNYDHPRSYIKVTGKLYTDKKKVAKRKTVYAGNLLTSEKLASLDLLAIEKKLNNRFGTKRANVKLKKGRMVPFMIVFSNLPDDLDEFTVEVAGSKQAKR